MSIGSSELILNADQSIYHLKLAPKDISDVIITVGDPDRVRAVSKHFDSIEIKKQNREFVTHTGVLKGKRLTVISTGIGTDNIDIVLNELDALANINFRTKTVKENLVKLKIVRIGTSGAIQPEIPIDSFLLSDYAIGFDGLLHYYDSEHIQEKEISSAFVEHSSWLPSKANPYVVKCDKILSNQFSSNRIRNGFTATNSGFYGPQGRILRLPVSNDTVNSKLSSFNYAGHQITNLEMETAGIYGLSKLLGHQAISLNCILANRATGEFSRNPKKAVDKLINYTLEKLTS